MYDKNNCAECNFHGDLKHKEKLVFCYVHNEWKPQYSGCEHWLEPTDMTKENKIAMATLITKNIKNEEKEEREEQRHQKQMAHENKLSWIQIIAGFITGLIVGMLIKLLF
jgi:hypothetical protein